MISRRKFLQASGVSIALPSLAMAADKQKTPQNIPLRYGFIFVPNGVVVPDFFDESLGKNGLPPTLQPLAKHKQQLLRF